MEKKKNKKNLHEQKPVRDIINAMPTEGRGNIVSDVLGSYTGNPSSDSIPEQDVDDL